MSENADEEAVPITGKVAAVVNARELVINRGYTDGVDVGMRFVVLVEGPQIVDPDSGQTLGVLDVPKTIVKVVRVEENFCVARTFRTTVIPVAGLNVLFGRAEKAAPERLKAESMIEDQLPAEAREIRIGDRVIETEGEEYFPGSAE